MKWLVVMVTIVCTGLADNTLCPPDQTGFSGSCYQLLPTLMTWGDANETCITMGGDLAVAKSLPEHQLIWDMFRVSDHINAAGVWVGCMRDEDNKWVNHRGIECSYFNWYWNEPNDQAGTDPEQSENCAEIRRQYYGQWNDRHCLRENSVVCELSALQQPIAPAMKCLRADANGRFAPKM